MHLLKSGLLRSASIGLVVLVVAACTSSGGSSGNPLPTSGGLHTSNPTPTAPVATATPTVARATATPTHVPSSAPSSGGTGVCPAGLTSGHATFTIGGLETWRNCGPASATVTLGSTTVHIKGGSCTVPVAGVYTVNIGTQIMAGDPPDSLKPDFLNIYIVSADGKTDPGGVAAHQKWLLIGVKVTFGPGKHSGSFHGTTIEGPVASGSFVCG